MTRPGKMDKANIESYRRNKNMVNLRGTRDTDGAIAFHTRVIAALEADAMRPVHEQLYAQDARVDQLMFSRNQLHKLVGKLMIGEA